MRTHTLLALASTLALLSGCDSKSSDAAPKSSSPVHVKAPAKPSKPLPVVNPDEKDHPSNLRCMVSTRDQSLPLRQGLLVPGIASEQEEQFFVYEDSNRKVGLTAITDQEVASALSQKADELNMQKGTVPAFSPLMNWYRAHRDLAQIERLVLGAQVLIRSPHVYDAQRGTSLRFSFGDMKHSMNSTDAPLKRLEGTAGGVMKLSMEAPYLTQDGREKTTPLTLSCDLL